jgi:recombination protein RecT
MNENKVAIQEKNITDNVLVRIKDMEGKGDITFPKDYSYSNALKSAYLILAETVDRDKKPVLASCSQTSICNSLLDMCIQGLSPAKKQCYFIPYGGKLQLSKSYLGNIAATKRLKGVKNVFANVIYEKDEFEYVLDMETGLKKITKHEQSFGNIDISKIRGAYAVVVMEDGNNYVEVMTMDQIKNAWNQGAAKGGSGAHKNFTDEMAKKTVINRACKNFTCTSDDSDLLVSTISRTNEYNPEDIVENVHEEVKEEIKENANKEVIDIPDAEVKEVKTEYVQQSFVDGPGF